MSSIKWIIFLIICINTLDITSFNVNFFKQSTKLFYVNAMNNENGDIYFEFWGEENAVRYFMGKNFSTEENIIINGNRICSINANLNWNFHESIIIKYNEDVNILSMNSMNFDYINLEYNITSSKLTTQLIADNDEGQSYRNCLIKLKNGNYLSSMILHSLLSHKIYMTIFELTSNNINNFKTINQIHKTVGRMNSTSCFQTESSYIQCSFANVVPIDNFHVGIYDLNLDEKETVSLGYLHDYTFTKIFHIKGEIGAYIFFDKNDNDVPKLFLKKLNDNKKGLTNIFNSTEYIILNNNGRYTLDYGLFSSDAIKIDDYSFVVILTIKGDSHDFLICLCDFNSDYTSIRIRYYYLNFSSINIKVDINIRSFIFKDYFGLLFYDSISEYPGYIYFNYPKIIGVNKIDSRTIKINLNLSDDISSKAFLFSEHLELINNIYTGPIKIKILNFSYPSLSGIIIKTSSKELSPGDIINYDEIIIFERNNTDIIPGEYFLEFYPFVEENESLTEIYGNNQGDAFEEIGLFTKYVFNLIYLIECSNDKFLYIKNEIDKYCLSSYTYEDKELFTDERENICYNNCSYATNGNIYLYNNKCMSHCPTNYISNENNTCILNEINSEVSQNIISTEILSQSNIISREEESQFLNSKEMSTQSNSIIPSKEISQTINSGEIMTQLNTILPYKEILLSINTGEIFAPSNSIIPSKEISQTIYSEEILIKSNSISSSEKLSQTFLPEEKFSVSSNTHKIIDHFSRESINLIKINENLINECYINIDSLINDYKTKGSNLEIKELEKCSVIYYCYSSTVDIDSLMRIYPNLIFIDFNECKNSLIKENILEENSEILIIGKQKIIDLKNQLLNNFEYDVYEINGTKIEDLSKCKNSKLEITSPINNNEDYEMAISLFEQGYDIFNLSSSFYYDLCLSAYLNNSDLTLSIRQNDIMKESKSVCLEGCIYNGVNLTTKRISCLCDLDYKQKNDSSMIKQREEVEENFFSYILGMINYKIFVCHKLLFNVKYYYSNFGFYTGLVILVFILILCLIYYCMGKKSITIQYLHHMPKIKEIKSPFPIKNISLRKEKNIEIEKKSRNYVNDSRTNNKKSKTFSKKNKNAKKLSTNATSIRKSFIQNDSKNKDKAMQLNNKNINIQSGKKNLENCENSKEKFEILSINNYINKKNSEIKDKNEGKKGAEINYSELTYAQAVIKDDRNIIQMFLFYLNNKFEIVQIIFYPNQFSHKSLNFSFYLYELLLDLTFNALLFSDDVISQKYYNNGNLLFITSQVLSISSNIISCFIIYITSYLVNYYSVFEAATLETKDPKIYFRIFIKISWFIYLKITIFYIIVFLSGFLCLYYLFIFCAIFKKIQKNLFMNYCIGILWSLVYKVSVSILSAILRKISIYGKYKRLYYISKYIDENI